MTDFSLPWYAALGSEKGVVITTNNTALCIQRLYAARKKANDPDLDGISIVQSPTVPGELWLVKRKSNEPPQGT